MEKRGRTQFPKATKPTNSDRSRVNNFKKSHLGSRFEIVK